MISVFPYEDVLAPHEMKDLVSSSGHPTRLRKHLDHPLETLRRPSRPREQCHLRRLTATATRETITRVLESFEGLFEDAFDDFLLHTTWPGVVHDVSGAPFVHEPEGDVQLAAFYPRATDAKNVWVLGERHELGLTLQQG